MSLLVWMLLWLLAFMMLLLLLLLLWLLVLGGVVVGVPLGVIRGTITPLELNIVKRKTRTTHKVVTAIAMVVVTTMAKAIE